MDSYLQVLAILMKLSEFGNPHTGEHLHTIIEHTGELWGLDYSPDGKTLASSGSGDGNNSFLGCPYRKANTSDYRTYGLCE